MSNVLHFPGSPETTYSWHNPNIKGETYHPQTPNYATPANYEQASVAQAHAEALRHAERARTQETVGTDEVHRASVVAIGPRLAHFRKGHLDTQEGKAA